MNFFRNKPLIVTIVVVAVLIVLVATTASSNTLSSQTAVAGSVLAPLQKFFYQLSGSASAAVSGEEGMDGAQAAQLEQELAEYKSKAMDYDELLAENQRLSALLEYKQNHEGQELKVAAVTGKEPSNWFDIFTIDLGAKDGVKENMPVITPDGLVGHIEEVGLNWSKVRGIIDSGSKVSASMERTRDVGVVEGRIGVADISTTLVMNFLPLDADVVEEDTVITSGLDGVYPKGLVVGTVAGTADNAAGKQVTIRPTVDFRRLEEVLVVFQLDETTLAVDEEIADESAVPEALPSEEPAQDGDDAGADGQE